MQITQKPVPKHGSRGSQAPLAIVNHISAGSMESMYNTFTNMNNGRSASSHFGISREGEIVQYVPIERAAWTQGKVDKPSSTLVKQMGINPNLYCVSIEHEGYIDKDTGERLGIDGDITEAQFWASCWLHKWIQSEVQRIYGRKITLNSFYVIGHYQIDSVDKPNCPGPKFPWSRLYSELAIADTMPLDEYEERIMYKLSDASRRVAAYAIAERIQDLGEKLSGPWASSARYKLLMLEPVLPLIAYQGDVTPEGIVDRVLDLYAKAREGRFQTEAIRKLLAIEPYMREKGLI
jgi:N-acetyl-anhydromuramyl-L-alanine amidase AmpD